ncbi:hypothetical protein REPUB_Repub16aG0050300 [Reevesia pubescens]
MASRAILKRICFGLLSPKLESQGLLSFSYRCHGVSVFQFNPLLSVTLMSESVRYASKASYPFRNVKDALSFFDQMLHNRPRASIVEFSRLFGVIIRMKHYALVISLHNQLELFGVSVDVFSINILIDCFCRLGKIDFGFSLFGKLLKLSFRPDVITFSTLINGLCT